MISLHHTWTLYVQIERVQQAIEHMLKSMSTELIGSVTYIAYVRDAGRLIITQKLVPFSGYKQR
jgi:hypothetical protein